jgi:nitric oxide reductase large subunit
MSYKIKVVGERYKVIRKSDGAILEVTKSKTKAINSVMSRIQGNFNDTTKLSTPEQFPQNLTPEQGK